MLCRECGVDIAEGVRFAPTAARRLPFGSARDSRLAPPLRGWNGASGRAGDGAAIPMRP